MTRFFLDLPSRVTRQVEISAVTRQILPVRLPEEDLPEGAWLSPVSERWGDHVDALVFHRSEDGAVSIEGEWHPRILVTKELVLTAVAAAGRPRLERRGDLVRFRTSTEVALYQVVEEDERVIALELIQVEVPGSEG